MGPFVCTPEASGIDPSPSYLHHTPSFLSSDQGGGATGNVVRFIVPIIPSELFKADREEQGQRNNDEDLASKIQVRNSYKVTQVDFTYLANA